MAEAQTFLKACKNFFGYKEGQQLKEFAEEMKQLTPQDKKEMADEFRKIGMEISDIPAS